MMTEEEKNHVKIYRIFKVVWRAGDEAFTPRSCENICCPCTYLKELVDDERKLQDKKDKGETFTFLKALDVEKGTWVKDEDIFDE